MHSNQNKEGIFQIKMLQSTALSRLGKEKTVALLLIS